MLRNAYLRSPLGTPRYFEGNLMEYSGSFVEYMEEYPYGFFEVEIDTPKDLLYPILQTRVKTSEGFRTVAPLGNWTGVYSSTELFNAAKNFGYRFKVKRGVLFERDIVYSKYVDYFNKIKSTTPKSDPMYLISKLLMNGLFGKTGQDYKFNESRLVNNDTLMLLIQNKNIEVKISNRNW